MDIKYEDLAIQAERGELRPVPGTVRIGEDAAAYARRYLRQATGANEDASTGEITRLALEQSPR